MNTTKLEEAIADLQQQRSVINEVIDGAISHLKQAIATLTSSAPVQVPLIAHNNGRSATTATLPASREGSHFGNAYKALRGSEEKQLHISTLLERMTALTGSPATRASVEGALSRNIRRGGARSLIIRTKPSTYALNPEQSHQ